MEHTFLKCEQPCMKEACMWCEGGLGYCTTCHGFEGTLPRECPALPVVEDDLQLIYKSVLDFRDGTWMRREWERWEEPSTIKAMIVDEAVKRLNSLRAAQSN